MAHFLLFVTIAIGFVWMAAGISRCITEVKSMNKDVQDALDAVNAKLDADATAAQRVIALTKGISAQLAELKANNTDPTLLDALNAIGVKADAITASLDAEVTADTPA